MLPESVAKALNHRRSRLPVVQVTKIDAAGKGVMRLGSQPAFISLYRYGPLLFSAAGQVKPKMGIKRTMTVKKGKMYMQTALKKRKTVSYPKDT